ncbi:transporter substrate-binding domain-containing protein [Clostridium lundense]|uniref:transporter substrate-binding domain-containing protein n=1 Tax=Clostridium lundense TaxID=319475 RepID=UPI000489633D|nr:transporter substrate-binding domain-containing protein [Clostridium lundense]
MKKKLKLIITFFLLVIVVLSGVNWKMNKSYLNNKDKNKVFKVAGDINFPPFEYVDEKGVYTGFNVDIIRAVALRGGIEVQFFPMNWEEACEKLKEGKIDIIQGMKYTKEREKFYDFSEGYLENSQSIFTLNNNQDISSYEKLENRKVAIQEGDVAISNLKTFSNVKIVFTKDQEEAFKKLLNGDVDAYIGNSLIGVNYIDKLNVRNKIKIVDTPLNSTDYSIAVKKGNTSTLNLINTSLKEIKNNGTYEMIYRKWFGYSISYPKWHVQKMLKIASLIIVIFSIAILAFYRWNDVLKEEVKKQTFKLKEANIDLLKKNEQVIGEKEFREEILNRMYNGIITIDKEETISFINIEALNMLKLNKHQVLGKDYKETIIGDIFLIHDNEAKNMEKEIEIGEKRIYISYKISLMNSSDKYAGETIISFRDITEEKLAQETIRTKDKMQSLGTLVSGIAHEIRNPLTSIKTYAELIPKKYDNPRFREMISIDIPKEIERLNNLINDLLEYSRPRKPFKESVNLLGALNGIMVLINDKILKSNIDVKINIDKDVYIFMDKNHLKQVLINLILNSIESMDKEYKSINIYTEKQDERLLLCIEDNGCGIDEIDIEKIYNPFYTTKATGTGLGLFVIYQLLSENNVRISLESAKDKGTKFLLEF